MTSTELQVEPAAAAAQSVAERLAEVRTMVRRRIAWRGAGLSTAAALLMAWALTAIDWQWELPRDSRLMLLALAAVAVGFVAVRQWFGRLARSLPDRSLALVVERRFQLGDMLLTAVELGPRYGELSPDARRMLAATLTGAASRLAQVDPRQLFDERPWKLGWAAAAWSLAPWLLFAALAPATFQLALSRILTISDAPWPRYTRLVAVGFEDGSAVVARGGEFVLRIQADTKFRVPEVLTLRYRGADGTRERKNLIRVGRADPERDAFQEYEYRFPSVLGPLTLDVRGLDARLRGLQVRVVESPSLAITLACDYPEYMRQPHREIAAGAVTAIPRGTRVVLIGRSNKDLRSVAVEQILGGSRQHHEVEVARSDSRRFEVSLGPLDSDATLVLTPLDTDGLRPREPVRLTLSAVADVPPTIQVRLVGIGSAITNRARLPLAGQVTDDYGVLRAWAAVTIDTQPTSQQSLSVPSSAPTNWQVDEALEVEPLKLKPGQRVTLGIEAGDNRALAAGPNFAVGERYVLDVVTPEQLRAQLDSRELNLRQRFETIIAEASEMRSRLAGIGATAAQQDAESDTAQLMRGEQNSTKQARETAGLAAGFDEICEELINNRVDTEELKDRLQRKIAGPLRQVADKMYPELQRRLRETATVLNGPVETVVANRQAAVAETDAILAEMARIREEMLKLETFNEALDMLRNIIAAQQSVNEATKKERAAKVRKLLEE